MALGTKRTFLVAFPRPRSGEVFRGSIPQGSLYRYEENFPGGFSSPAERRGFSWFDSTRFTVPRRALEIFETKISKWEGKCTGIAQ
jgi:hypothetical protein